MKNIIALSPILFLLLIGCKKQDNPDPLPNGSAFYPKISERDTLIYVDSNNNNLKFFCYTSYKQTKEKIINGKQETKVTYNSSFCNIERNLCCTSIVSDSTIEIIFGNNYYKAYLKDLNGNGLRSEVILGYTYNKVFDIS